MRKKNRISSIALKIAAVYAVFGFLWILLSDKLLLFLVRNQETVNRLQTYKGWFYVLITAALVAMLIDKYIRTLRQSERRYRRLLSNIADSIYLVNAHGRIVDSNNAARTALGYSEEEFRHMPLDKIEKGLDMQRWVEDIANAEPDRKRIRETSHSRKDGTILPVEISTCVFNEKGERYVLGVARDISERRNTQELLVQHEKMNSLGSMAAGIAHEINNPLSAILGACQNIRNRLFKDSPQNSQVAMDCGLDIEAMREYMAKRDIARMVGAISAAGERASKIVTSMINFSNCGPAKLHGCNIAEIMDETLQLISADLNLIREYDFKNIRIVRDFPPGGYSVCCIKSAIQQVLLSLFKNATEAMAEKEYAPDDNPEMIIRVHEKEGNTVIEVEDNGPGMDEDVRKKIFEPFYTSKDVGRGTGLGLSVSYFIVTSQHNGTMEVTSSPGRGTTFTVTLPGKTGPCAGTVKCAVK
ncbi:ATP-binding protein [Maridesulfovibrio sp.]|uniref:two-component system sensor histidine kinase NtrB n=1 Tax=Maridesulfovibrio sp. TaxID=2795000 RepID=UPI002A188B15|nr:ATP-binding protein [Maridesulfovibrio sp.]